MLKKGTTPDRLKNKGIPQSFVNTFIGTFNTVYEESTDEGRAYRTAYTVMGKALRKAGYRRTDSKWKKKTATEELEHSEIRSQLRELLLDHYEYDPDISSYGLSSPTEIAERVRPWIVAVYSSRVVYERGADLWSVGYAVIEEDAELRGSPVQVKKEYVPIVTHESADGPEEIALVASKLVILEEDDENGARMIGVALVDEAISAHNRYYSKAFNDRCMAATNAYMAEGGTVTVYSRHGKAIPPPGQIHASNLPVGKLTKPLWRKGGEIWYEAFIAPTTEGKDVVVLLKTKVMTASSIRASTYRSRRRRVDGHDVEEMVDAIIVGIDLADVSGITGAGVRKVLEEAPLWTDEYTNGQQEVTDMKWTDITLAALLENRKDVLEEYAASVKTILADQNGDGDDDVTEEDPKKVVELTAQVTTLNEEKEALTTKLDAATQAIAQENLTMAIATASLSGVSQIISEELGKVVKKEADIAELLPEIRTSAIALLLNGTPDLAAPAKGQSRVAATTVVEEDLLTDDEELTEGQREILSLAR